MRSLFNFIQPIHLRFGNPNYYIPLIYPASQSSSCAEEPKGFVRLLSRKWRHLICAVVLAGLIVVLGLGRHGIIPDAPEILRSRPGWWGLSESEGWDEGAGLADLGEAGETAYKIGLEAGSKGSEQFFTQLSDFILTLPETLRRPLASSLSAHLPPSHRHMISSPEEHYTQAVIDHKTIYLTDKTRSNASDTAAAEWSDYNRRSGWKIEFFDDHQADTWVRRLFGQESEVVWAWKYMERGVLRADFFRYLIPLIRGGVYTDIDVEPFKPIERWGRRDVEYLSLAGIDGPRWRQALAPYPSVIIGIEADVHSHPQWHEQWPRPLGICQWTLGAAPSHPIFLDAARRVVNSTKVVRDWEEWRASEIQNLRKVGREAAAAELESKQRGDVMPVLDWTGPGLFTDATMAFLLARYNITWHRLRGLDHPLRIGDVLVLPITAFSPGGEPDFHAGHHWEAQGAVVHRFRGSWKYEGY